MMNGGPLLLLFSYPEEEQWDSSTDENHGVFNWPGYSRPRNNDVFATVVD
jgi:hypothetical protein